MSRVRGKHNLDFQGFLTDLHDWELSIKEKDKKLKDLTHDAKEVGSTSQVAGTVGKDRISARKAPRADISQSSAGQFDFAKSFKNINRLSSSLTVESSPTAASEKDLGNEFFKQKKFKEAVDCYSRSIALSPTAVAFANRAMAYLKIKRFEEAEIDCTEALNLDDRYIKAYSRRATARKELGKLKASVEDSEFSLRLEPQNQELKKQYAEAKAMYEKDILDNASRVMKNSIQGIQRARVHENRIKIVRGVDKLEPKMSVQELASRAASRAMAEAEENTTPPKSAYQFEISWKRLSGDRTLQANLLKAISPSTLPHLFKNSLSATLLIDIIKCISTFFKDETELAVKILESLTNVSRFDMIIMCLFGADKFDLAKMWVEVFLNAAVPVEYVEVLSKLRPKYCLGG